MTIKAKSIKFVNNHASQILQKNEHKVCKAENMARFFSKQPEFIISFTRISLSHNKIVIGPLNQWGTDAIAYLLLFQLLVQVKCAKPIKRSII